LIHSGVVKSAHDCSEGGLTVALAECCISQQIARETPRLIGAQIDLTPELPTTDQPASSVLPPRPSSASESGSVAEPTKDVRVDALLFGETQGRILISVAQIDAVKVLARAKILGIPATWIGIVGGETLNIKTTASELSWPVAELHDLWWNSIARAMK
jgi:phosphoribosylformylglycinamidine synthase